MTEPHRGFTRVHPSSLSLAWVILMARIPLRRYCGLRAPPSLATRAAIGNRSLDTNLKASPHSFEATFTSHWSVRPKAPSPHASLSRSWFPVMGIACGCRPTVDDVEGRGTWPGPSGSARLGCVVSRRPPYSVVRVNGLCAGASSLYILTWSGSQVLRQTSQQSLDFERLRHGVGEPAGLSGLSDHGC